MTLINKLRNFVQRRPGFDYGNYGEPTSYRADVRRTTRQLNDARQLLRYCELFNITPDLSAFSGRLELQENGELYYCAGQYYCTEYRAAVCACCSSAICAYWRDNMSATEGKETYQTGIVNMGDAIRKQARNEFGRGIANRWFN